MTPDFKKLESNIENIEKSLVSKKIQERSNLGTATDRDNYICLGYRLLVHAEIEDYFEKVCININQTTIMLIKQDIYAKSTAHLLSYVDLKKEKDESKKYNESVKTKVLKIAKQHEISIENNHGITQKHLEKMMRPLGLNNIFSNTDLLENLRKLSERRGEAAHKSSVSATHLNSYSVDKQLINNIIRQLKEIDEYFEEEIKNMKNIL